MPDPITDRACENNLPKHPASSFISDYSEPGESSKNENDKCEDLYEVAAGDDMETKAANVPERFPNDSPFIRAVQYAVAQFRIKAGTQQDFTSGSDNECSDPSALSKEHRMMNDHALNMKKVFILSDAFAKKKLSSHKEKTIGIGQKENCLIVSKKYYFFNVLFKSWVYDLMSQRSKLGESNAGKSNDFKDPKGEYDDYFRTRQSCSSEKEFSEKEKTQGLKDDESKNAAVFDSDKATTTQRVSLGEKIVTCTDDNTQISAQKSFMSWRKENELPKIIVCERNGSLDRTYEKLPTKKKTFFSESSEDFSKPPYEESQTIIVRLSSLTKTRQFSSNETNRSDDEPWEKNFFEPRNTNECAIFITVDWSSQPFFSRFSAVKFHSVIERIFLNQEKTKQIYVTGIGHLTTCTNIVRKIFENLKEGKESKIPVTNNFTHTSWPNFSKKNVEKSVFDLHHYQDITENQSKAESSNPQAVVTCFYSGLCHFQVLRNITTLCLSGKDVLFYSPELLMKTLSEAKPKCYCVAKIHGVKTLNPTMLDLTDIKIYEDDFCNTDLYSVRFDEEKSDLGTAKVALKQSTVSKNDQTTMNGVKVSFAMNHTRVASIKSTVCESTHTMMNDKMVSFPVDIPEREFGIQQEKTLSEAELENQYEQVKLQPHPDPGCSINPKILLLFLFMLFILQPVALKPITSSRTSKNKRKLGRSKRKIFRNCFTPKFVLQRKSGSDPGKLNHLKALGEPRMWKNGHSQQRQKGKKGKTSRFGKSKNIVLENRNHVEKTSGSDGNGAMVNTSSQVPEEKFVPKEKNKLFIETNDNLEKPRPKSSKLSDFKVIYKSNYHVDAEEQYRAEFLLEESGFVKLMQPPQDERSRQSTFAGTGNQWYTSEEFSRGGFSFNDDGTIICFSCKIQHHINEIVGSPPSDAKWHHRACRHALRFRSIPPRGHVYAAEEPIEHISSRQVTSTSGTLTSDGAISDTTSEAPGQRSIYIPSGDSRKELYRLSTFENYPNTDANIRKALASHGFYFTGFSDQVKCFNCARSVVRWVSGDNPADLKWHKPSCQFIRGDPCGNIPIRNVFGDLAARIAPTSSPSVSAETVLQQRDPNTGALIRTVRYPADLPERLRQQGGTFTIGPNNELHIQSGPVRRPEYPAGSRDPPPHSTMQTSATRNAVVNPPQPRAPVPTWRMANVASSDHKRFLTNLYLNRELDRLTSFARWPTDRPNVPPSALAKTGFYYLGDMDRVQCFSCGGVLRNWTLDDSAEREHRTHFGGCNMVLGNEPLNIPIPSSPESPELLATNYPLRFPSNPHMRGQAQRESTFDRRWPTGRINVSIEQIAEAGFFYLGERDRVKCWYCNGGLQNWEFDDVPWDEHAKWFPNCQFLLRMKGQRFVHHHLAPHAQLARPVIGRQDGSPLENIRRSPSTSRGYDIPPVQRRPPTPPPTIIDPQEETRKRKERVKNILRNSEIVKNVLGMGFSEQIVETVIEDRILSSSEATTNGVYGSVSELLDDVMKKEEEMKQEEEQRRNQMNSMFSNPSTFGSMVSSVSSLGPAPGSGKYNVSYFGDDDEMNDVDMYGSMEQGPSNRDETQTKELAGETTESLKQQLEKIEEERMCKICFSNVADMLFFPCSHMVCCMECTQAIRHCPICRKQIERAFKTYVK